MIAYHNDGDYYKPKFSWLLQFQTPLGKCTATLRNDLFNRQLTMKPPPDLQILTA